MSTLTSTTSSTRPSLGSGDVGKSYFETDSNKILVWDGSAWNEWNKDSTVSGSGNTYSVELDGTNDNLSFGNLTNLNSAPNLSLSVWFKFDSLDSNGNDFSFRNKSDE
jgi:hypothetical protein